MGHKLVGILLNADMHRGVPRLKTGQESLSNYEEAAAAYGLVPCFLKLADIDTDSGFSAAYIKGSHGYKSVVVPTPTVIHNRAIYSQNSPGMQRLLRHHPLVYNTCNRYGKDEIHELLEQHEELREVLPATTGVSGLKQMMNRYPDLILKPCRGSIGNGVMRLVRKGPQRWSLNYLSPSMRRWISTPVYQGRCQKCSGYALPLSLISCRSVFPLLRLEDVPLIYASPFNVAGEAIGRLPVSLLN